MSATAHVVTARLAAARYLADGGYPTEAAMAADGRGDDFAEVRIAMALLAILPAIDERRPLRQQRRLVGEEC